VELFIDVVIAFFIICSGFYFEHMIVFTFLVGIAYLFLRDGLLEGQSVGKRILRIAVVDNASGVSCDLKGSLIRNFFIVTFLFIDLFYLVSKLRQRLGDMVADTIVIKA